MSRNPTYLTNSAPIEGFTDAGNYDQIDVSDENSRTYVFGTNKQYRIELPLLVAVKKGASGHSHRVLDAAGQCHYIPSGWIAIYWDLRSNVAIPLPDLSEQMSEAQKIEAEAEEALETAFAGFEIIDRDPPKDTIDTEDLEKAKDYLARHPAPTVDEFAEGIFKAIDALEDTDQAKVGSNGAPAETDPISPTVEDGLDDQDYALAEAMIDDVIAPPPSEAADAADEDKSDTGHPLNARRRPFGPADGDGYDGPF